jgi:hypothetical protein
VASGANRKPITSPANLRLGHFQNGHLSVISSAGRESTAAARSFLYSSDLAVDPAYRNTAAAGRLLTAYLRSVQARQSSLDRRLSRRGLEILSEEPLHDDRALLRIAVYPLPETALPQSKTTRNLLGARPPSAYSHRERSAA